MFRGCTNTSWHINAHCVKLSAYTCSLKSEHNGDMGIEHCGINGWGIHDIMGGAFMG